MKWFNGRETIKFSCVAEVPPYHVIQYLENLGVYVWPVAVEYRPNKEECQTREATILIRTAQKNYACGLIKGFWPNSVLLLTSSKVKAIKPKSRWGSTAKAKGFNAIFLRFMAGVMGFNTKLPPTKIQAHRKR